eukprot:g8484.t1
MSDNLGEGKGPPAAAPSPSEEFGRKRSDVHITWDEPTIAEHDKLRGTRQKIDEPSTPYHYGSGESSTGSDCESADGKGMLSAGSSGTGSPHHRVNSSGSARSGGGGGRRSSILKVMADVSAALPSESALRKERQARWDSDVSQGSSHEDKEKARKFKQHREAHYNEFKALQEWRHKRAGDMMDDDSDSEDEGDTTEELRRRRPGAATANGASSAAGAGAGSVVVGDGGDDVAKEVEDEEMNECGTADSAASANAGDSR